MSAKNRGKKFSRKKSYSSGPRLPSFEVDASLLKYKDESSAANVRLLAPTVTEESANITQYLCPSTQPFRGILKQRYSDFIVSELDEDGKVVRLTNSDIPPTPAQEQGEPSEEDLALVLRNQPDASSSAGEDSELNRFKNFLRRVQEAEAVAIEAKQKAKEEAVEQQHVVELGQPEEKQRESERVVVDSQSSSKKRTHDQSTTGAAEPTYYARKKAKKMDQMTFQFEERSVKEERAQIYALLRRYAGLFSASNEGHVITAAAVPGHRERPRLNDSRDWPWREHPFISFILLKENRDTMDVVLSLSKGLRISSKLFSWAGTKDKRAVTQQRMTVSKTHPSRLLQQLERNRGMVRVRLGNFKPVKSALNFGDHGGNHFTVTIRHIEGASEQQLMDAAALVEQRGFLNYFGLQRFGNGGGGSHVIGRFAIRREWAQMIQAVFLPEKSEHDDSKLVKMRFLENGDAEQAERLLPSRAKIETEVIAQLAARQKGTRSSGATGDDGGDEEFDFVKRIGQMDPLGAINAIPRNMRMLYGHAWQSAGFNLALSERIRRHGANAPVAGDLVVVMTANDEDSVDGGGGGGGGGDNDDDDDDDGVCLPTVHSLTEAEATSGEYSIEDVVLPLPGYAVEYPSNDIGEVYRQYFSDQEVTLAQLRNRSSREFNLPGNYRKMIIKPANFKATALRYDDSTIPLSRPDLGADPEAAVATGRYLALVLEFALPPSTYATMLYRELMKTSSSKQASKVQGNNFWEDKDRRESERKQSEGARAQNE